MIKKLAFIFFLTLFFIFLFKSSAFAQYCISDMNLCKKLAGSPQNKCCRESSCSSKCAVPLKIWEYCYGYKCCSNTTCPSGSSGYFGGYCNYYYEYTYKRCSTADTCISGEYYLRPGICDTTGCTVGGIYKACCRIEKDGTRCLCSGGKNTGTCFSGC